MIFNLSWDIQRDPSLVIFKIKSVIVKSEVILKKNTEDIQSHQTTEYEIA